MKWPLVVCSENAVENQLNLRAVTHVVSITDRGRRAACSFGRLSVLRLAFDDISSTVHEAHGYVAPSMDDVGKIVRFAREMPPDAKLLVHCAAGISRSPASAIIMLAAVQGDPLLHRIVRYVFKACISTPRPNPNTLMLDHAEAILRLEHGSLVGAVHDARAEFPPSGYMSGF